MIELKIPEDNILYSAGDKEEYQEVHKVLVGQLKHTMNMIKALEDHPHFTDDCGEYLQSALEISSRMMVPRQDGIEALYTWLIDNIKQPEDNTENWNVMNYASDGISNELEVWAEKHGWKDKWD